MAPDRQGPPAPLGGRTRGPPGATRTQQRGTPIARKRSSRSGRSSSRSQQESQNREQGEQHQLSGQQQHKFDPQGSGYRQTDYDDSEEYYQESLDSYAPRDEHQYVSVGSRAFQQHRSAAATHAAGALRQYSRGPSPQLPAAPPQPSRLLKSAAAALAVQSGTPGAAAQEPDHFQVVSQGQNQHEPWWSEGRRSARQASMQQQRPNSGHRQPGMYPPDQPLRAPDHMDRPHGSNELQRQGSFMSSTTVSELSGACMSPQQLHMMQQQYGRVPPQRQHSRCSTPLEAAPQDYDPSYDTPQDAHYHPASLGSDTQDREPSGHHRDSARTASQEARFLEEKARYLQEQARLIQMRDSVVDGQQRQVQQWLDAETESRCSAAFLPLSRRTTAESWQQPVPPQQQQMAAQLGQSRCTTAESSQMQMPMRQQQQNPMQQQQNPMQQQQRPSRPPATEIWQQQQQQHSPRQQTSRHASNESWHAPSPQPCIMVRAAIESWQHQQQQPPQAAIYNSGSRQNTDDSWLPQQQQQQWQQQRCRTPEHAPVHSWQWQQEQQHHSSTASSHTGATHESAALSASRRQQHWLQQQQYLRGFGEPAYQAPPPAIMTDMAAMGLQQGSQLESAWTIPSATALDDKFVSGPGANGAAAASGGGSTASRGIDMRGAVPVSEKVPLSGKQQQQHITAGSAAAGNVLHRNNSNSGNNRHNSSEPRTSRAGIKAARKSQAAAGKGGRICGMKHKHAWIASVLVAVLLVGGGAGTGVWLHFSRQSQGTGRAAAVAPAAGVSNAAAVNSTIVPMSLAFEASLLVADGNQNPCAAWFTNQEDLGKYSQLIASSYSTALKIPAADVKVGAVNCTTLGPPVASNTIAAGDQLLQHVALLKAVYTGPAAGSRAPPANVADSSGQANNSTAEVTTRFAVPSPSNATQEASLVQLVKLSSGAMLAAPLSQTFPGLALKGVAVVQLPQGASLDKNTATDTASPSGTGAVGQPPNAEQPGDSATPGAAEPTEHITNSSDKITQGSGLGSEKIDSRQRMPRPSSVNTQKQQRQLSSNSTAPAPQQRTYVPGDTTALLTELQNKMMQPSDESQDSSSGSGASSSLEEQLPAVFPADLLDPKMYGSAATCLFAPSSTNSLSDTQGRLWGWMKGTSCLFRAPDEPDPQNPGGLNPTSSTAAPTWDTAPQCSSIPAPHNSMADNQGHLWGWQNGASCTYPTSTSAGTALLGTGDPASRPEQMSVLWEAAAACPFAPTLDNTVPDVFGRYWAQSDGTQCAFKAPSLPAPDAGATPAAPASQWHLVPAK